MAKFTFFFGALLALAVCSPGPGPESVFAMGSRSGPDEMHRQGKQTEQTTHGPEKNKDDKGGALKENPGGKKEKSPPQKKPRLKYRDPYECGC
jgi:hypothetical protein